jgi:hypothetical protein
LKKTKCYIGVRVEKEKKITMQRLFETVNIGVSTYIFSSYFCHERNIMKEKIVVRPIFLGK